MKSNSAGIEKQIYQKLNSLTGDVKKYLSKGYEVAYRKIKNQPYMDLVIEKYSKDSIILAHYGEQNGDLMSDPMIEIRINNESETAEAVYYENHYAGVVQYVYDDNNNCNPRLKAELNSFLNQWLDTLKEQGFYE